MWRRRTKSVGGLVVDGVGVGYKDAHYDFVVPWRSLVLEDPVQATDAGVLLFHMVAGQPGVDYVLRQLPQRTDRLYDAPFTLYDEGWAYRGPLPGAVEVVIEEIRSRRAEFGRTVESRLPVVAPVRADRLAWHDADTCTVGFQQGVPLRLPAFCPLTGDPCSAIYDLGKMPWFISLRGERWLKKRPLWLGMGLIFPVVISWVYGALIMLWVTPPAAFPWREAWTSLTLFLCAPLLWYFMRDRITTRVSDDGVVQMRFADRDYFEGLVELNTAVETRNSGYTTRGLKLVFSS